MRRVHESLVGSLRNFLVDSSIARSEFGLLHEFLCGAEEVTEEGTGVVEQIDGRDERSIFDTLIS